MVENTLDILLFIISFIFGDLINHNLFIFLIL